MNAINDAALVAGTMKKADRRGYLRDLNKAASGSAAKSKPKRSSAEVTAQLAGIGIPVERV